MTVPALTDLVTAKVMRLLPFCAIVQSVEVTQDVNKIRQKLFYQSDMLAVFSII